jgi:peptidylprolyl isomerase/peptidyl-prolyl cis-trans isomerase D
MAILSKIRDRSAFLIIIVGLALFAFVLDPTSIQQFFSSVGVNDIGAVNGEKVDRESFAREVEAYSTRSGGRTSQLMAAETIWNRKVDELLYEQEMAKAGIKASEDEIWDAIIENNSINSSQLFEDEEGNFDERKLKEYIAELKENSKSNPEAWMGWIENENNIKEKIQRQEYIQLVKSGIGASLEEGKQKYQFENQKTDASYVYMKFSSINDTLVNVSEQDVRKYVKNHPKKYPTPEPMRSINFVKFEIEPSTSDEEKVKEQLESFIEDKQEFNGNQTLTIQGLENTTDYEEFFFNNESDISFNDVYLFENELPASIKDELIDAQASSVLGPYKEANYYKISKVLEITKIPDSIKYHQIAIPFTNSLESDSMKNKEEAKKTIDSIFNLVKYSKDKFTELAAEFNSGLAKQNSGDMGWTTKNRIFSRRFDKDIANFMYEESRKKIEIIESAYSYQIIRIDEERSFKNARKLATFARLIEPSEETENNVFLNAETFASNAGQQQTFEELAKEKDYKILAATNLKRLDENIPNLGQQRSMVTWAFNSDRKINDSNKFELDINGKRAYVVAQLSKKTDENDLDAKTLKDVEELLKNEQKRAIIVEKLQGDDLETIAKNNKLKVSEVLKVTWENPFISGVGREPGVVAALTVLPLNKISKPIEGQKGVLRALITNREMPIAVDSYEGFRAGIVNKRFNRSYKVTEVLKEKADITDNRVSFY